MKNIFSSWKQRVWQLKRDIYALFLAYKDPRTPWYARLVVACVVGYAVSPIDLVPDFIPVLGYLDDLLLLPLGIMLALRLIPPEVMAECRARAALRTERLISWPAAVVIVAVWLLLAVLAYATIWK